MHKHEWGQFEHTSAQQVVPERNSDEVMEDTTDQMYGAPERFCTKYIQIEACEMSPIWIESVDVKQLKRNC